MCLFHPPHGPGHQPSSRLGTMIVAGLAMITIAALSPIHASSYKNKYKPDIYERETYRILTQASGSGEDQAACAHLQPMDDRYWEANAGSRSCALPTPDARTAALKPLSGRLTSLTESTQAFPMDDL